MTIKDRKEREKNEMKELIVNAAAEIFKEEGLEKVSIRKIADRIEYSSGIIYHYFEDKDEIMYQVMRRGYGKIVEGLSSISQYEDNPEKRLKEMIRKIIHMALQIPEEYCSVHLSKSPNILAHTASLFKGAAEKKQALGILNNSLKEVYKDMDNEIVELTAQIIWTSTFGLIIKLIIENDLPEEQRNKLIEHHIRCIIDGIVFGKTLNEK